MDTSRFVDRDSGFPVLDLFARFAFRSASSISFNLGRYSDRLPFTDDDEFLYVGPGGVFVVTGRVDVHHPCEGHIKTQLHVVLPAQYHPFERMREFVAAVFEVLGIPSDETFESVFVISEHQTSLENATDRDGMTDRIY